MTDHVETILRRLVLANVCVLLVAAQVLLLNKVVNGAPQEALFPASAQPPSREQRLSPSPPVHRAHAPPATRVDALDVPPVSGVRTVVSLTFDDGVLDQYALRGLLPASGLTATLYVNSGLMSVYENPPDRMSLWALRDLSHHGVEIGGHTVDHPNLTDLTVDKARAEICDDRDQLHFLGFPAVSFAYPFSETNPQVERIPRSCGYLSARSVGGIDCRGCTSAETFPPKNRYLLRTPDPVGLGTTLRDLKDQVLAAEAAATARAPAWLILNFHHICGACNEYAIPERRLAALLGWLSRRPPSTAVRAVGAVMLHGFE